MKISIIAAVAENYIIGKDGTLPWRLSSDLKWFKNHTVGKPIVMGRKTYLSIGKPLPDRQNIVVSNDQEFSASCAVVRSLDEAIAAAGDAPELMVIGGRGIYEGFIDRADRLYLTVVHARPDGDTRFPPIDAAQWRVTLRERVDADDKNSFSHTFYILDREQYGPVSTVQESLPASYRALKRP